jgi:hypothetical protein
MADNEIRELAEVIKEGMAVDSHNEPIKDNNSMKQSTTDNSHFGESRINANLFWVSRSWFKQKWGSQRCLLNFPRTAMALLSSYA